MYFRLLGSEAGGRPATWAARILALRQMLDSRRPVAYGVALLMCLVPVAGRQIFGFNDPAPFLPFYPALIVIGLLCGRGPAYLVVAASGAFTWWYFALGPNRPGIDLDIGSALILFAVVSVMAVEIVTRLAAGAVDVMARDRALVARMDQLIAREQALGAQLSELQTLYDEAPVGLGFLDTELRFVRVNAALADFNGFPVEAHIGQSVWSLVPNFRETAEPLLRRVMERNETIRNVEISGETAAMPGVTRKWIEHFYPVHGEDGSVQGVGILCAEVTELRQAQERERLLMREVDHRARNLLTVVQSIVNLTKPVGSVLEYRALLSGRIQSLGRVHGLLAANRWDGVLLADLVRQELAPFGSALRIRGGDSGEAGGVDPGEVLLPPPAAQALSMILHELATNSAKHGALSADGAVELVWSLASDPEPAIVLTWTETGGPPVGKPERVGFGTSLLQTATTRVLGGTLDYRLQPAGLFCRLTIPLEAIGATRNVHSRH